MHLCSGPLQNPFSHLRTIQFYAVVAFCCAFVATPASSDQDAYLTGADGTAITASSVRLIDDIYFVETILGEFLIDRADVDCAGPGCPDLIGRQDLDPAIIRLQSRHGETSITGELLSFDDGGYVVSTPIGEIMIIAEQVKCHGASCP